MTTMDAVVRMLIAGHPYQLGKEDGVSTNHCLFVVQALTKRLFPLVLSPGTVLFFIRGMEDWMVQLSPPAHCCGEESSRLETLPLQCYAK